MAWYKLYIVEMRNRKYLGPNDGKKLIKFGITHHMDIMKRFDPEVDDGYEKNYGDWIILPKYSQVFYSKEEAEAAEKWLLNKIFPAHTHKVWVEDYLQCEDRNQYYHNTGITELRLLTNKEIRDIIAYLKKTQSMEQREANMYKLLNIMKGW